VVNREKISYGRYYVTMDQHGIQRKRKSCREKQKSNLFRKWSRFLKKLF